MFYLAQSYHNSGDKKDALPLYLKRAEMGYWDQEVYVSLYRAAELMSELDYAAEEVIGTFIRAQDVDPKRAEAFHGAARCGRVHNRAEEGYRFAKAGLKLSLPEEALFLDEWIYDYGLLDEFSVCAYWLGKYDECLSACRRLIRERKIPSDVVERVERNAQFAREKLAAVK